jgi:hypothetical protein
VSIEGRVCGVRVPGALIINCLGDADVGSEWALDFDDLFRALVFPLEIVRHLSIYMSLLDMCTPAVASFSTLDSLRQRLHMNYSNPIGASSPNYYYVFFMNPSGVCLNQFHN